MKSSRDPSAATVALFRRKLALFLFLKHALMLAAAWGFAWGTVVLAARAVFGTPRASLLWGLAGLVPAAAAAALAASRRLPAERGLRARLDQTNGCGGLLMAAEETDPGLWRDRLAPLRQPSVRWRARRALLLFASSCLWVAASFLGPWRLAAAPPRRPLDIGPEAAKLGAQLDVLRDEKILEPARVETLEAQIAALESQSDSRDPGRTWEALDHVRGTVTQAAAESAEKGLSETARLSRAEELAEALAAGVDPVQMAGGMRELAALAAREADSSSPAGAAPKGASRGGRTRNEPAGLASRLRGSKEEIARRLGRLRDAHLIDRETLEKCRFLGKCDGAGLAAFLKAHAAEGDLSELMRAWSRGGIDRGRGDALMTFADESRKEGSVFKDRALPPGGIDDSSTLVGMTRAAPEVERNRRGPGPGALSGAASGRGAAFTSPVLPRHRGAVKRFFERP